MFFSSCTQDAVGARWASLQEDFVVVVEDEECVPRQMGFYPGERSETQSLLSEANLINQDQNGFVLLYVGRKGLPRKWITIHSGNSLR